MVADGRFTPFRSLQAKVTMAAVKGLAAGGWVVLLILLFICLIAMLLGSVFGGQQGRASSGQAPRDATTEKCHNVMPRKPLSFC